MTEASLSSLASRTTIDHVGLGTSGAHILVSISQPIDPHNNPDAALWRMCDGCVRSMANRGVPSTFAIDGWRADSFWTDRTGDLILRFERFRGRKAPADADLIAILPMLLDTLAAGMERAKEVAIAQVEQQRANWTTKVTNDVANRAIAKLHQSARSQALESPTVQAALKELSDAFEFAVKMEWAGIGSESGLQLPAIALNSDETRISSHHGLTEGQIRVIAQAADSRVRTAVSNGPPEKLFVIEVS